MTATSMDSPPRPVRYDGQVIGYVWRTEPKMWAFKRAGAMLVGGYRGSMSAAREACIQHWIANQPHHGDKP